MLIVGMGQQELGKRIGKYLGKPIAPMKQLKFADGEIYVRIDEAVADKDVFII